MKKSSSLLSYFMYGVFTLLIVSMVIIGRQDILPASLNPLSPIDLKDEPNFLTQWKLRTALSDPQACKQALRTADAQFLEKPDLVVENPLCGIQNRVVLSKIGSVKMQSFETRCETALRLAAWLTYSVEPLSEEMLGRSLSAIDHYGSYNCRAMRTSRGNSTRMSKHATGDAVDISAFRFSDGSMLSLRRDWDGEHGAFMKETQKDGCDYFPVVLGPEYNQLHADHFHMDSSNWRACR